MAIFVFLLDGMYGFCTGDLGSRSMGFGVVRSLLFFFLEEVVVVVENG